MNLNITIKNFGKHTNTSLQIRPLTIITGESSSGKTFALKAIQTIIYSIHQTNIDKIFNDLSRNLSIYLNDIEPAIIYLEQNQKIANSHQQILTLLKKSKNLCTNTFKIASTHKQIQNKQSLIQIVKENLIKIKKLNFSDKILKQDDSYFYVVNNDIFVYKNYLNDVIFQTLNILKDEKSIIFNNLSHLIERELKNAFNVKNLNNLKNDEFSASEFDFHEYGKIYILDNYVNCSKIDPDLIIKIKKLLNIMYFESAIFWQKYDKLLMLSNRFKSQISILTSHYPANDKNSLYLEESLSIASEINGQIKHRDGEFTFYDTIEHKNISLKNTSLGKINLAVIDYMIKNDLIRKNSVLFFDEPEQNLTPRARLFMIQVLYMLYSAEVTVIFTTHSFKMLKYIEQKMDLFDGYLDDEFAVNLFDDMATQLTDASPFEKILYAQEALDDFIE